MPTRPECFAILGVSASATAEEIKVAYRKLALQYHPDHHPDDKHSLEKFKEVNEAYSVLTGKSQPSVSLPPVTTRGRSAYADEEPSTWGESASVWARMAYGRHVQRCSECRTGNLCVQGDMLHSLHQVMASDHSNSYR